MNCENRHMALYFQQQYDYQLLKCSIDKLEQYVDLQSWIIWPKTFIATQSFMLLAKQSSGNCQK